MTFVNGILLHQERLARDTVATAATWTVLQGLDGVGIKQAAGHPSSWTGPAAIGVDVGYSGLASGLQDALGLALLVVLVFAVGILAAGMRDGRRHAAART